MTDLTTAPPSVLAPEDAPAHLGLDALEVAMLAGGLGEVVDMPLVHRFTPGLYAREIFMRAGTLATSKIHTTEHPYVVISGRASVFIPGEGVVVHIEAPHVGITKPGTRRLLYMHEDTRWITFHPLSAEEREAQKRGAPDEELLTMLEARIIERRELSDGSTINDHYRELLGHLAALPGQDDYGGAP